MSTTAKTVQLTQLIDDEITRLNPRTNCASVDIILEQNPNLPENIKEIMYELSDWRCRYRMFQSLNS